MGTFGYIYIIENDINGKLYVGQTVNPYKREIDHFSQTPESTNCLTVHKAMGKYGSEHFEFVLIDTASSQKELDAKEKYWIKTLNSLRPRGYNLTEGGHGGSMLGRKHSPETLAKMRDCKLGEKNPAFGKKHTKKWKENMSKRMQGRKHPLYGTTPSEETKKKLRDSHKGKKPSAKTRQKMSNAHAGENNAFFGKKHTEETRKKMRESAKHRPKTVISAETRAKMVATRKKRGWCKKFRDEEGKK